MNTPSLSNKIFRDVEELIPHIEKWREEAQRIIFTNGCFDLMHKGHVDYLWNCGQQAEKLVVGLNSDKSIRIIKGVNRPICNQQSRAIVLASMEVIDAVVLFNEATPLELIKVIRPSIIAKGGDYNEEEMIGAEYVREYGGKVEILPFVEGYSSSMIIEKIRKSIS